MALLHLEWVPCNQLQTDQRVKEFGQTEADIRVSVAVRKVCPPHFKMRFDAVKRMEVFHDILKYFLALLDDALCRRRRTLVRHKQHNFWFGHLHVNHPSPFSVLKLVMSVDVSSSSDDKPSLCSALFPFCSRACRLRALRQTTKRQTITTLSKL